MFDCNMKLSVISIVLLLSVTAVAQDATKDLHLFINSVLGENTKDGIGLGLKYVKGSNQKGFLAVNLSFNLFPIQPPEGLNARNNASKKTFLLAAGYHRRLKDFYIEPQAGAGVYAGRLFEPEYGLPSQAALCWGLETGYFIRRFSVQAKYQAVHTKENVLLGRFFYYGGIGLAYRLSSNK